MQPFKSTILELNQASALVLQTLAEQSPAAIRAAINEILAAYKVDQLDCIELNDISQRSGKSTSTVRKLFIALKKVPGLKITPANHKYEVDHNGIQLYSFDSMEDIALPADKPKEDLLRGSASVSKVNSRLAQDNIYIPENYRGITEETTALIPQTQTDSMLIACGNTVVYEKQYTDSTGHVNRVKSTNGIINDFDVSILDILFQKTASYYASLPNERQQLLAADSRIPIFIDDILAEKKMPDLAENRMAISGSFPRIWGSQYQTKEQYFSDQEYAKEKNFQFFSSFDGLTANADAAQLTETGELVRPYVCVTIEWHPKIFNYITQNPHLFVQNSLINSLPTLLYAFYRRLRLYLLLRQIDAVIARTKTLQDLVEHFWSSESPEVQKTLCRKFIADIKKLAKKNDSDLSVTYTPVEGDERAVMATVALGGFTLIITIPHPDRPSNSANRLSSVFIEYFERAVIEHTGAKYDSNRANNTPTLPNPLAGKKRQLATMLKRNKNFDNLEFQSVTSDYYFGYCYAEGAIRHDFLITAYSTKDELEGVFSETASLVGCDVEQFRYYIMDKIARLKPMPQITQADIDSLVECGLDKSAILTYLCDNIRSAGRLKRENFESLKKHLAG